MEIRTDALLQHPSITATNQNKTSISEKRRCKKKPPPRFYHHSDIESPPPERFEPPPPPRQTTLPFKVRLGSHHLPALRTHKKGYIQRWRYRKGKRSSSFPFFTFFSFPFLNTPPLRARSQKKQRHGAQPGSLRS